MVLVYKNPNSDVELSVEYEHRPLYIFLNDESIVLDLVWLR